MHSRGLAYLAIGILILLVLPAAIGLAFPATGLNAAKISTLSVSPNYTESLSLYLTTAETLWQSQFSGGNITLGSLSIPPSVTSFSIMLTNYQRWNSKYELFTKYGYGLLGSYEPLPDGAILVINGSSQSDAATLANSLNQMFGVNFVQYSVAAGSYVFMTPLSFSTEIHVYFWRLVPTYYKGFAAGFNEQMLESNDLSFYKLSYSAGAYSITIGGLKPLAGNRFSLYTQLGLSSGLNYSSASSDSTVQVHVLGGLVANSTKNNYNNFSAFLSESSTNSTDSKVPNMNATLDFSFPTLVAYRQIQTLNPFTNQNYSASVLVRNASPSGTPTANNVLVNDTWLYNRSNALNISVTQGKPYAEQNLSSGQSMTLAYQFKILHATNGTFSIPQIPISYNFLVGNKSIVAHVFLNSETLYFNSSSPALEAIETPSVASILPGQPLAVNVTIVNKGNTVALNLNAAGENRSNLLQGATWNFVTPFEPSSLTQTNSTVSFVVTWSGGSVQTNSLNALSSFGSPGSPSSSIFKSISFFKSSNIANITYTIVNSSPNAISNITLEDSLPSGTTFAKSYNSSSLKSSSGLVLGNITSLKAISNMTFIYSLNITQPNENYVFYPANVSSVWNGVQFVHYSQGFGLPLGVSATKNIAPSAGFQGSTVSVQIGISNQGTLPIYDASLNPSVDNFLTAPTSGGAFKAIVASGSELNSTFNANLTGTPGVYNSTASGATFIFAGYNQTATSSPFRVTIFQDVQAVMSVAGGKVEELHDMVIQIELSNPSNLTVSNVAYSTSIPNNLVLKSGNLSFVVPSLGPDKTYNNSIILTTDLPDQYSLNGGTLHFQYNGQTLNGQTTGLSLSVADDLTIRYGIPGLIGVLIVLGTLFYVRRLTGQTKP
jgi:uncharacterized repeat protein (TIGR01451 family)